MEDKPILYFRDLKKPGTVSIFATLKDAKDLVAKNKKPYLRLVLIDPFSQERLVQIWGNHDLYAPLDMFMRKNLLNLNGPIHLMKLNYDGEFIGSTKESQIDTIPTQHPLFVKYQQLTEYRLFRNIPDKPEIIQEIKKLLLLEPYINTIIEKLEKYHVTITEQIRTLIIELLVDKTYTGTIYLIDGNPQLTITEQYANYLMKQIDILLEGFKKELPSSETVTIILLRRLKKDLISLYEYTTMQQQ